MRATLMTACLLFAGIPAWAQQPGVGSPDHWRRTLEFSGYTWAVKASTQPVGPGPNYFSDSPEAVWVDEDGRLHMRIAYRGGRWWAAEVSLRESLGYGIYAFELANVDGLDPNAVLGLFTWSDNPAEHHREIDIEISRWGAPDNDNAQCVVQPYNMDGNVSRFGVPPDLPGSHHSFRWAPGHVTCLSRELDSTGTIGEDLHTQRFTEWIPQPGDENVRINLWLIGGEVPTDGRDVEAVIVAFRFEPLEDGEGRRAPRGQPHPAEANGTAGPASTPTAPEPKPPPPPPPHAQKAPAEG